MFAKRLFTPKVSYNNYSQNTTKSQINVKKEGWTVLHFS